MQHLQRMITIGCIVIGILVLIGTVSAFFSPAIQAALTLPTRATMPRTASTNSSMPVTQATQPAMQATMTAFAPSPTAAATGVLAQDTFQRGDQRFWGTASGGQRWGGLANSSQSFAITGDTGLVATGQGAFDATLGPRVTDAEVEFSGSLSLFNNSITNLGSILRWMDANNWYKAYIDGTQLVLLKKVAGKATQLAAIPFPAQNGQVYTLRFRVVGTMLAAKVWVTGQKEPVNWMLTATDSALTTGFGGLRPVLQNGVEARITMYVETAVGA